MPVIPKAPALDFFSTSLNGSINNNQTTGITLNSVTNLQAPGVLIVDRQTSAGAANPTGRELISFTSISGSALAGTVTRGYYSVAYAHNDAAVVESVISGGVWNSLVSLVDLAINSDGYLRALISPASVDILGVKTKLVGSNASIVGFTGLGINPVWRFSGAFSGATTFLAPPIIAPTAGNWESFTFVTRTVASGVSAIVDVKTNGSSIFNSVGRPMIAAGGTFASTASIATKAFNAGDKFTVDYAGVLGLITDITIQGRAI